MQIDKASNHQVGAVLLLSSILYSMHCSRRVDPRHVKNLLGKLKRDDRPAYEKLMTMMQKQYKVSPEDIRDGKIRFN